MLVMPTEIPRTGGPFYAPGAPGAADTTFSRTGSKTVTSGGPTFAGGGSPYADLLRKLIERKIAATEPAAPQARNNRGVLRAHTSKPAVQTRGGGGEGGGADDEVRRMHAIARAQDEIQRSRDAYDASVRGAATKPIAGFNYMGMIEDTSKLPTRLRPQNANMIPGTHVPTGSIESPVFSPDSLYGYSAANPRAEALGNLRGGRA